MIYWDKLIAYEITCVCYKADDKNMFWNCIYIYISLLISMFSKVVYKIMTYQFKNTKLKVYFVCFKIFKRFNSIWMSLISFVSLFLIVEVKLKTTVQDDEQTNWKKILERLHSKNILMSFCMKKLKNRW